MTKIHRKVVSRNESFDTQVTTKIWQEQPSDKNPYLAITSRCYGYDIFDLMEKCSFIEVFFLLMKGELPTKKQKELLEKLMIAFINLGPRHPATRAAMAAGASQTDTAHLLPISLAILGGEYSGGREVVKAMCFFRDHLKNTPECVVQKYINASPKHEQEGDWSPIPGFGTRFNDVDPLTNQLANQFVTSQGAGKTLKWAHNLATHLEDHNCGWLPTGLAAAIFCDLDLPLKAAPGLFQLLCAPGLVAHGSEYALKPMTAMPFPKDKDYIIE